MTQREKLLAGGVGGVLGIYAAYWGIRSAVYDPYQDKLLQIKHERERHDSLSYDASQKINELKSWTRQTQRTLESREHEEKAMQAFREDVQRLLSDHGFTTDENLVLTPNSRPIRSRVLNEEDTVLSLKIDVRGELGQMVDFLRDMYRRPYLVRVDKLTMNAESGGPNPTPAPKVGGGRSRPPTPGSRRGGGKPASAPASAPAEQPTALAASPSGGPRLRFMVQISTLLLPENKEAPYKALTQTDLETKIGDLLADDVDYTQIAAVNPFQVWEPAAVAKGPDAPPPTETTKPAVEPPKPPTPKKKETLVATISLNGEPLAYVRNDDRKQDAPRELKLNDELDGGKIIFMHPYGIVVRVKGVGATPGKEYFYPIGSLLSDRKELSELKDTDYPGVLKELADARRS